MLTLTQLHDVLTRRETELKRREGRDYLATSIRLSEVRMLRDQLTQLAEKGSDYDPQREKTVYKTPVQKCAMDLATQDQPSPEKLGWDGTPGMDSR